MGTHVAISGFFSRWGVSVTGLNTYMLFVLSAYFIYLSGKLHVYPTSYYKSFPKQRPLGQGQGCSTLRTVLDQSASAFLSSGPS